MYEHPPQLQQERVPEIQELRTSRPTYDLRYRPVPTVVRGTREPQLQERRRGILEFWYRASAPPVPPDNASLAQRELARRGRLASVILLFTLLLGIIVTPTVFFSQNPFTLPVHWSTLTINVLALVLNRRGKVGIAGGLVVISLFLTLAVNLVSPTGLGVSSLPLFELLVVPELIAVSLLPASSVYVVALMNSLFAVCDLLFVRRAPDLEQLFAKTRFGLILQPIILYILVAVVTYLWVRSATQALIRADRAEEIAALEQRELERQQGEIEQKRQLDLGIQQILQTHVQVANGNFRARAPLTQENILWQVAYSLNNLIARLQGYSRAEIELRRLRMQVAHLVRAVHAARHYGNFIWVEPSGTLLDPLITEINGNHVTPSTSVTKTPTSTSHSFQQTRGTRPQTHEFQDTKDAKNTGIPPVRDPFI